MKTTLKIATLIASLLFLSFSAQAESEVNDVSLSFHEALSQSNADYNHLKKKAIDEENDRTSQWGERGHSSITIEADIAASATLEEFNDIQEDFASEGRQVSALPSDEAGLQN